MIIEAAFLTLPEFLETSLARRHVREATVTHSMATAVLAELYGRSVPHPAQHVVTEKRYAANDLQSGYHVDLYVDLSGAVPRPELMAGYGYRPHCWIEVKTFVRSGKPAARRRSDDIGRIIRDLLRVCLFPKELQGAHRENARFLLMVGTESPGKFWGAGDPRSWIFSLCTPGQHSIEVPVKQLCTTSVRGIGDNAEGIPVPTIELEVNNLVFRPDQSAVSGYSQFWGSLSRIISYKIAGDDWSVSYEDRAGSQWSAEQNFALSRARKSVGRFLARHNNRLQRSVGARDAKE